MNHNNIIIVYTISDNEIIAKSSYSFDSYSKWTSLEKFYKVLRLKNSKIKYFDEENELISIKNNEDFNVFQNVVLYRKFLNDEVFVLLYTKELCKKLQRYDHIKNLTDLSKKPFQNYSQSNNKYFGQKLLNSCHNDTSERNDYYMDELSSSSSSSFERCKAKKNKSIKRYSAEIKKELNYLSGSEISDGQTILKKWRIKNIGIKKWKNNSVKCVLLPSEYSNWVQYDDIKVPVCFADQKVDIEMKIKIVGRWTDEQSNHENISQNISLKWLLFMDKLVKEEGKSYTEYILTQLDLSLKIKMGNNEFGPPDTLTSSLKKQTSESSIEKIDQEYSIVNMSDECEFKSTENLKIKSPTLKTEPLSEIEIDLPECPNPDDFQITDFHNPKNFISNETRETSKTNESSHNSKLSVSEDDFKPDLISIIDKQNELNSPFEDSVLEEANKETINLENTDLELEANIKEHDNVETENINEENDKEIIESEIFDIKEVNDTGELSDKIIEINNCQIINESSIEIIEDNNKSIEEKNSFGEDQKSEMKQKEIIVNSVETIEKIESDCGNKFEESNNMENDIDNAVNVEHSSIENTVNNGVQNEAGEKHSLAFGETTKPDLTPLIKNSENQQINNLYMHNESNFRPIHNNFQTPPSHGFTRPNNISNNNFAYPYVAGVIPNIPKINNYPVPIAPPNVPINPYMPYNHHHFNPVTPVVPHISPVPIQNQSSDKIIRELMKNGNIHDHINEPRWVCADNGQHYETTTNLKKLEDMGFTDRDRNYRLLMKFANNMGDVIHELID